MRYDVGYGEALGLVGCFACGDTAVNVAREYGRYVVVGEEVVKGDRADFCLL